MAADDADQAAEWALVEGCTEHDTPRSGSSGEAEPEPTRAPSAEAKENEAEAAPEDPGGGQQVHEEDKAHDRPESPLRAALASRGGVVSVGQSGETAAKDPGAAAAGDPEQADQEEDGTTQKTTMAAAALGGLAGLVFLPGTLGGLAAAAGFAYATTREDKIGTVSRDVGNWGLETSNKMRTQTAELAANAQARVPDHVNERINATAAQAAELTAVARARVSQLDEEHGVSERVHATAAQVAELTATARTRATQLHEEHRVAERVAEMGDAVTSAAASATEGLNASAAQAARLSASARAQISQLQEEHRVSERVAAAAEEVRERARVAQETAQGAWARLRGSLVAQGLLEARPGRLPSEDAVE